MGRVAVGSCPAMWANSGRGRELGSFREVLGAGRHARRTVMQLPGAGVDAGRESLMRLDLADGPR